MADANNTASTNTSTRQVSESAFDFLVAEIVHWIQNQSSPPTPSATSSTNSVPATTPDQHIIRLEQNAAKMERMGYDVGFRFTERLASTKAPMFPLPGSSGTTTTAGDTTKTPTAVTSTNMYQIQLEVVKFICKDFWIAVFHKQMDRLQTNHRGTFVLKDLDFAWLKRLKRNVNTDVTASDVLDESSRMTAMQLLAFICGMIRGALASFGIGGDDSDDCAVYECDDPLQQTSSTVVVTCDFFADGKTLESCTFQIKILPKE